MPRAESHPSRGEKDLPIFIAIIVAIAIVAARGYALRSGRDGQALLHRPYNNRYNDASGAREETFG